ncbi:MAG: HAMP domain-containing histidine kinase [Sphaerochaetaceae bacterium]|nr:HAMP domain-containing histidine kinase [Sphaerochaetaceae bacterium]
MKKYFWRNFILIFSVAVITLVIQNGILFLQYNSSQNQWKKEAYSDFVKSADLKITISEGDTELQTIYDYIDGFNAVKISGYAIEDKDGNTVMEIRKEPGDSTDLHPADIPLEREQFSGTGGVPGIGPAPDGINPPSSKPDDMPQVPEIPENHSFGQGMGDFVGSIDITVNDTPYRVKLYAYSPMNFEYTKDIINSCYRSIIIAVPVCLLIALVISFFISRNNTASVNSVRKALGELRNGEHGVKVEKARKSELKEIAEDIEALDMKLEADDRARKAWLTSISHDLNTPATGIKLIADGLADGIFPPDEETLQSLRHESDNLNQRISRVVDYSTLQSAKLVLSRVSCAEFAEKVSFANQDLGDFKVVAADGEIVADTALMEKACRELLTNALTYGCNAELKVSSSEGAYKIEVINTGKLPEGMTEEGAFEPWSRGDQSRHSGGSGLGLPITATIARLHGGDATLKQLDESLVCATVYWSL